MKCPYCNSSELRGMLEGFYQCKLCNMVSPQEDDMKEEIKLALIGWFGGDCEELKDIDLAVDELYTLFKKWEGRK